MFKEIECLGHSTIKICKNDKVIYIDPYNLKEVENDADYIFITHAHYDHFSEEDIKKIKNENTIIIITEDLYEKTLNLQFADNYIIRVIPNENYNINGISFFTVPAYNNNKKFHPKDNNWVGYILDIDNAKYYIAGDTDLTEDNKKVKCDVAFVPVGGTYTMDAREAAELVNEIKPKKAIPIHYGTIVGSREDAENFKMLLNKSIECEILIK